MKKWVGLFLLFLITGVYADTYTNRAVVVTQDGDLTCGQVVYVISVERAGGDYMVHRFCVLDVDKFHEYRLAYDTPSGSDVIHIPQNIIDIADDNTNKMLEEKYHFYKPQLWMLGVLNE